jgi:hypothetical protein
VRSLGAEFTEFGIEYGFGVQWISVGSGLQAVDPDNTDGWLLYGISSVLTVPGSEPPATTPEPGTILGLLAVGSVGALTRKRKG